MFGYAYVCLGDIVNMNRGVRVTRKQLLESGTIPVYQNSVIPLGYYNKSNCDKDTTYVIAAGAAGEIGYSDIPFWAADDCYYFEKSDFILNKYLYYCLLSNKNILAKNVRKASVPRLPRISLEKLIIPIPPLDEQKRIVSVLDRFDTLCNDISKGLPAEIETRQKQYEYYRDKLLTFKEVRK